LELGNNATTLPQFESRHNLSQADGDAIKTRATAEADTLKALQSNPTLMQNCAVIEANRKLEAECHQMKRRTELSSLADNQTALREFQAKHNLTAAEVTEFTERAKNATTKLATLQKNSTLVDACKAQKQGQGQGSGCKCTQLSGIRTASDEIVSGLDTTLEGLLRNSHRRETSWSWRPRCFAMLTFTLCFIYFWHYY
jgi:hypothetical protein